MRSSEAGLNIRSVSERAACRKPLPTRAGGVASGGSGSAQSPAKFPRTGNKEGAHTDLIDLSVGAIANHFHQLENPSRILGESREGLPSPSSKQ